MGKIKQFAGQTLVYGIGSVLSKVVYYLLVVVLLTYLLEDKTYEFGTYGELYAYTAVLLILFSLKLDTALFRYGNDSQFRNVAYANCLTIVLISSIFLLIVGFTFTDFIASLIEYPHKPEYIRWFSLILAFDIVALIPFAKLRLDNKAKVFAALKIFNVFVSSVLILFFLLIYPKYNHHTLLAWIPHYDSIIDYVFLSNLISSAILLLLVFYFARPVRPAWSTDLLKKIFPYVVPLIVVGVCNTFIQTNGVVMIKYLSGASSALDRLGQAGLFDSSRRIAGLFVLFIGAFNYAAEPFFFNNNKTSDKESLYGQICHLFILVSGMVILFLVLGKDLVQYMAGKSFRESLFMIPILLVAYLFLGIYHNISIWYKLSDKTHYGAIISIVGAIITFVVSYIFIPISGYVAFAFANLFCYFIMVIIAYYWGQKIYPIFYPLAKIIRSVLVIIAILILAYFIERQELVILKYFVFIALFVGYCVYAYFSERAEWLQLFSKNKS